MSLTRIVNGVQVDIDAVEEAQIRAEWVYNEAHPPPIIIPNNRILVEDEIPLGVIDGINNIFMLSNIPITGTLYLYLNGLKLSGGGNDYTISSKVLTMINTPYGGDVFTANYQY